MARVLLAIMVVFLAGGGVVHAGLAFTTGGQQEKLALVVGVADYDTAPRLKNTVNDAELVAASLERLGFEVTVVADPDKATFERAVAAHSRRLAASPSAVSFFYYAGQGMELEHITYMAGVDADMTAPDAFRLTATSFDDVVQAVSSANGGGISFFLFDACRDNPFPSAGSTRAAAGMERSGAHAGEPAKGRFVVYATGPDGIASDGIGDNGPFAIAVAAALAIPDLDQSDWFRELRNRTVEATNGKQVPAATDSLTGDYVFNPTGTAVEARDQPQTRAARAVYEAEPGVLRPTYEDGSHALLIGVGQYDVAGDGRQAWRSLPAIPGEIERLGAVLRDVHGFEVETVIDPTGDELEEALESFVNRHGAKPNARLVIMMAGHGATTETFGKKTAWFVPRDAPAVNPPAPFRNTALNLRRVEEWSEILEAKHVLWIFDSCFSGAAIKMIDRRSGEDVDGWSAHLHTNPVRRVITSGSENEEVPATSRFAERLVDVLSGRVRLGDGSVITGGQIGTFLREDVIRFNYKQGLPKTTPQSDTIVIPGDEGDIVFRIEPQLVAAWQAKAGPK